MKNILVISAMSAEGCVIYRGLGPFSLLRDEFNIIHAGESVTWMDLAKVDAVFLQYASSEAHEQIIAIIKKMGIPLWVDYDDDFTCVPHGNVRHEIYAAPAFQDRVKRIIAQADVVTVSTSAIANTLMQYLGKDADLSVISNAYDVRFHGEPNFSRRTKTVTWRGGDSHQVDVMSFYKEILRLAEIQPDVMWAFLGMKPAFLTQALPKMLLVPWSGGLAFMDSLKALAPLIHMVPLEDCAFNHGKSNIAWLEATMAGALCVAPDWTEWKHDGIFRYNSPESFLATIDNMLMYPKNAIEAASASWETIQKEFMVEHTNHQRRQILRKLFR